MKLLSPIERHKIFARHCSQILVMSAIVLVSTRVGEPRYERNDYHY